MICVTSTSLGRRVCSGRPATHTEVTAAAEVIIAAARLEDDEREQNASERAERQQTDDPAPGELKRSLHRWPREIVDGAVAAGVLGSLQWLSGHR